MMIQLILVLLLPFQAMAQEDPFDAIPGAATPVVTTTPSPTPAPVEPTPAPVEPAPAPPPQDAVVSPAPQETGAPAESSASPDTLSAYESRKNWELWNADPLSVAQYQRARKIAFWTIAVWFLVVFIMMGYLFYRYQFRGGLRQKAYWKIVQLIDENPDIPDYERPFRYPQNPYKNETLGLPTGTVRGVLTLTLLVANCLVLYVIGYAPPSPLYRNNTEYITTAFLMMIAFYFGSKSVDVFKAREESRRKTLRRDTVDLSAPAGPTGRRFIESVPPEQRPATTPHKDFEQVPSEQVKVPQGTLPSLKERVLALTAYFETGKKPEDAFRVVAGDFDGMGISMGCLQWNIGQNTLQPILTDFFKYGDQAWKDDQNLVELQSILSQPLQAQLAWARGIQAKEGKKISFKGAWGNSLKWIGDKTKDFQLKACEPRFQIAKSWCNEMGLTSERAFALMFDINVQNGSLFKVISKRNIDVRRSINQRIAAAGTPDEEQRLIIIAEERARASHPQWVSDVLSRKLAIAKGRGRVHNAQVDLHDFDIRLDRDFVLT